MASTLEMFIDDDEINNYYLNTEVADVLIEEGVLIKKLEAEWRNCIAKLKNSMPIMISS